MSKIISIHSYRGGTGKSNITANLATALAAEGQRVGVVDTDIQSPGIHAIFGLNEAEFKHSLNDYLWGLCDISDAAYDMTGKLDFAVDGKIFLIPSSLKAGEIARILREGYDVGLLDAGFQDLTTELELDALLIDTHPGLNEETLLSIVVSDVVLLILRPDTQDYMGTSVTVEVARKLDVNELLLVVNKVPKVLEPDEVKQMVEDSYDCPVVAVIPHSDEMMTLGSSAVFIQKFSDNEVSQTLVSLARRLMQ